MTDHWIVTVNGVPTDIRGDSGLALRQGKIRKSDNPAATVELHYGPCNSRTYHNGSELVVELSAPSLGPATHIATVL